MSIGQYRLANDIRKGWRKGWQPNVGRKLPRSVENSYDVSSNHEELVLADFSRPWISISARLGACGTAEKTNHCMSPTSVGIEKLPSCGTRSGKGAHAGMALATTRVACAARGAVSSRSRSLWSPARCGTITGRPSTPTAVFMCRRAYVWPKATRIWASSRTGTASSRAWDSITRLW